MDTSPLLPNLETELLDKLLERFRLRRTHTEATRHTGQATIPSGMRLDLSNSNQLKLPQFVLSFRQPDPLSDLFIPFQAELARMHWS